MKKSAAVVAGAILALGGAAPAFADAGAEGAATGSPGVLSGNTVQIPIHIPVNACGNTVDVIALLNPAFGNTCSNT
ncbi:chaplin [Streptomyces sp. NPDC047085]|uniref:chaplin n=1 Tax=Streptomyces sp. NPDC047085 TaxID=3155140 RepID=UPI0033EF32A6